MTSGSVDRSLFGGWCKLRHDDEIAEDRWTGHYSLVVDKMRRTAQSSKSGLAHVVALESQGLTLKR